MEYCKKCNGLIGKYEYPSRPCPYCRMIELLEHIVDSMVDDGDYTSHIRYCVDDMSSSLSHIDRTLDDIKDKMSY